LAAAARRKETVAIVASLRHYAEIIESTVILQNAINPDYLIDMNIQLEQDTYSSYSGERSHREPSIMILDGRSGVDRVF
jgi:putative aminopeptidase FrvX